MVIVSILPLRTRNADIIKELLISFIAMNKITKLVLGAVIVAPALIAGVAFAATTQTYLTLDAQTTSTIQAGDSVDGVLTFNNTGNSTVQSLKVEIPNSQFPPTCINVSDQNSTGTHTVAFPVSTTGATEGTYDVRVTTYGIPVNQTGANNNCDGTIGVSNTHTFNNVLTLTQSQSTGDNSNNTGTGSTGGTGSTNNQAPAWFTAWLATQSHTGGTTNTAKCDIVKPFLGATPYAYSSLGVQLQSALLLDNPLSIPALHAGATIPMGYFGVQTHAALAAYDAMYNCN